MQINSGYTLIQMWKVLKSNTGTEAQLIHKFDAWIGIHNEPLKKEQFINEMGSEPDHTNENESDWHFWQEAENKVIFKGWGSYDKKNPGYLVLDHATSIDFDDDNYIELDSCAYDETICSHIKTIGDLFTSTNGTLETQNINI